MRFLCLLPALMVVTVDTRAADLPTPAQVEADARRAVTQGELLRLELDGDWKLEREAGSSYAHLAKQAVIATKRDPDGHPQHFNALVIYQRDAPTAAWQFDRLFSYGFRSPDGRSPAATLQLPQAQMALLAAARNHPQRFAPVDLRNIYRVDGLNVVPGSITVQDDHSVRFEVDSLYVIDASTSSTARGVKQVRYRFTVEALLHRQTGEWILSKAGERGTTDGQYQVLTAAQLASLPTLADVPFDQLYYGAK